ncbi:hypothetical protein C8F04DRAFT_1267419 [Mycena alexandri]|uniref:Uncharacterized protein n=1 Tax=Mycena alexandri TaxID=1745969 RepID=A0AAD6WTZ9_9AGAR|nr:hypothetical protein C8F04DRAFT_1267419 [Mycena alexandri]
MGRRGPFLVPSAAQCFNAENILRVVPLTEPSFGLPDADAHGPGAPPALYSGNSKVEKIGAIHRAALYTPCRSCRQHVLFSPTIRYPTIARSNSSGKNNAIDHNLWTSDAAHPPKKSAAKKGDAKVQWDMFSRVDIPEMPPAIDSMAVALAQVDRGILPYTSKDADKRYILPEPALLVHTVRDRCRHKFLHHWNLLDTNPIDGAIDISVFESLVMSLPAESLLPNIRKITSDSHSALFPYLRYLVGPHLDSIMLGLNGLVWCLAALSVVPLKCPSIQHVDFALSHASEYNAKDLKESVSSFVIGLQEVRTLEVVPLNQAAYQHLAGLLTLESLTLHLDIEPFPANVVSDTPFPALREIRFDTATSITPRILWVAPAALRSRPSG